MSCDDSELLDSLVVLEFQHTLPQESVEWLIKKLKAKKSEGGAELDACIVVNDDDLLPVVHIGAEVGRLIITAEVMQMRKPCSDGTLREISVAGIDSFSDYTEDLNTFLTTAEKQRVIQHEMESVRALESEKFLPGLPEISFYKGEAIFAKCQSRGLILNCFPLHNKEKLNKLSNSWYKQPFKQQPIDAIHRYFGETIAMYFAFLGFYTVCLVPPAALGIISQLSLSFINGVDLVPLFCIFNLVWGTIFLEAWKRNCATLAYKWGTYNMQQFEEPRPEFYGEVGLNKVTGHLEPEYSDIKRYLKFYFVSVPIVIFSLILVLCVMLTYFYVDEYVQELAANKKLNFPMSEYAVHVPTIVYALVIPIFSYVYQSVAVRLTDWENHRLQSTYENNLITKLVVFNILNNFVSLFYVAFYKQDFVLLRKNLATLLITSQLSQQVQEAIIPFITYKFRKGNIERHHRSNHKTNDPEEKKLQAAIERTKPEYPGTMDDYQEMFLQFGYVFLFSAVFPTAAFWALLNNLTEIRTDAFKLCRTFRRPFSQPTDGMGAWQVAFELMSVVAVITNCALVALTPQAKKYMSANGEIRTLLLFVLAEHVILFIKITISYLIPDVPGWIEKDLASIEYKARSVWRKQTAKSSQDYMKNLPTPKTEKKTT